MIQELLHLKRLALAAPPKPRWVKEDSATKFYVEARRRVPALVEQLIELRLEQERHEGLR